MGPRLPLLRLSSDALSQRPSHDPSGPVPATHTQLGEALPPPLSHSRQSSGAPSSYLILAQVSASWRAKSTTYSSLQACSPPTSTVGVQDTLAEGQSAGLWPSWDCQAPDLRRWSRVEGSGRQSLVLDFFLHLPLQRELSGSKGDHASTQEQKRPSSTQLWPFPGRPRSVHILPCLGLPHPHPWLFSLRPAQICSRVNPSRMPACAGVCFPSYPTQGLP